MKISVRLLAFVFMFIGSMAFADTKYVYSPGDGYLNLRTGPSTQYDIVKPMYNGQRVWVISWSGNWRQVRHESGTVGWAYASYLVDFPVSGGGVYYINSPGDGYLNLRTGPTSNSGIIRQMPHGSTVNVVGNSGQWLSVVHETGARGWAFHRYLSSTPPPAYTPQTLRNTCSDIDNSVVGWYIRAYKCGDKSISEYPCCLAHWRQKLCETNMDPAGFITMLMNDRG